MSTSSPGSYLVEFQRDSRCAARICDGREIFCSELAVSLERVVARCAGVMDTVVVIVGAVGGGVLLHVLNPSGMCGIPKKKVLVHRPA